MPALSWHHLYCIVSCASYLLPISMGFIYQSPSSSYHIASNEDPVPILAGPGYRSTLESNAGKVANNGAEELARGGGSDRHECHLLPLCISCTSGHVQCRGTHLCCEYYVRSRSMHGQATVPSLTFP
jgi:hypothetical protein